MNDFIEDPTSVTSRRKAQDRLLGCKAAFIYWELCFGAITFQMVFYKFKK